MTTGPTPLKTSILRHLHDAVDLLVDPHEELSTDDAAACDAAFCTLLRLGRLIAAKDLAEDLHLSRPEQLLGKAGGQ